MAMREKVRFIFFSSMILALIFWSIQDLLRPRRQPKSTQ
jgi:hypothetical protein